MSVRGRIRQSHQRETSHTGTLCESGKDASQIGVRPEVGPVLGMIQNVPMLESREEHIYEKTCGVCTSGALTPRLCQVPRRGRGRESVQDTSEERFVLVGQVGVHQSVEQRAHSSALRETSPVPSLVNTQKACN
jgi:hypothetical protein